MLISSMLFAPFQPPGARTRFSLRFLMLLESKNTGLATPRKSVRVVRQMRVSVVERLRTAWAGQIALRSFDSAHGPLCYAVNLWGASLRMTILWAF
jgi:hypothetical protein